jgi:hypothetical protein
MTRETAYSEQAIARRLERLSQLRELCVSLSKAPRQTPSGQHSRSRLDHIRDGEGAQRKDDSSEIVS